MSGWALLLTALVVVGDYPSVSGHGRLLEPPSRSSMWRFGFGTPRNYNDNELYCGGFQNQVSQNGKCGVCGDPYQAQEKPNERGGLYGEGPRVRFYESGDVIQAKVQLTANHKGWMQFAVCPTNSSTQRATEDCFRVLQAADGSGDRFPVSEGTGNKTFSVKIPDDLVCHWCVFRWKYNAGNSWGTDPDGTSCIGCGAQEQFYGCADVAISGGTTRAIGTEDSGVTTQATANVEPTPSVGSPRTSGRATQTSVSRAQVTSLPDAISTTQTTRTGDSGMTTGSSGSRRTSGRATPATGRTTTDLSACHAVFDYANDPNMDAWCQTNCAQGYCPKSHCSCSEHASTPCRPTAAFEYTPGMRGWCAHHCAIGSCSPAMCVCP